jgi:hypothetical protein
VTDTDESYSGPEFTSSRGNEWPANFTEWPRTQQIDYVSGFFLRRDLIRRVLTIVSPTETRDEYPAGYRLDKTDLAAVFLFLRRGGL